MFESTVVKAKVITDQTGIPIEVPVILTPEGPLDALLEYLIDSWASRSPAWMLKVIAAVRIFLDYLSVHSDYRDEKFIFENFRKKLLTGTISNDGDPSGLWWSARSQREANRIIGMLTDLFNWWSEKHPGTSNPAQLWIGSKYDLKVAEAAYRYRRNQAFLGHTWSTTASLAKSGNSGQKKNLQPQKLKSQSPLPSRKTGFLTFCSTDLGSVTDITIAICSSPF